MNITTRQDINFYYYRLWILFLCIGFISSLYMLFFEDFYTALLYFSGITIYMFLMYFSLVKNISIFLKIFSSVVFLGYFVSIPIIYSGKETYTTIGWTTIGKFDFSFNMFYEAYLLILLIFSTVILISLLIERLLFYKCSYVLNQNISFQRKLNLSSRWRTIFIAMLLGDFVLSHFMLQHKIGITGITPDFLPYKLAGIMYYYRLFIIPMISFLLIATEKNQKTAFILSLLIVLEAVYSGILSTSRILFILHCAPALYFAAVSTKPKTLLTFYLAVLFIALPYVSYTRNYLYGLADFSSISIIDIINYFININFDPVSNVWYVSSAMVLRNLGFREFVIAYFSNYNYVDTWLFIRDFWGLNNMVNISFDVNDKIFQLYMPGYMLGSMALDMLSIFYLSSKTLFGLICLFILSIIFMLILERYLLILLSGTNKVLTIAIIHIVMFMFIFHPAMKSNLLYFILSLTFFIFAKNILPKKTSV